VLNWRDYVDGIENKIRIEVKRMDCRYFFYSSLSDGVLEDFLEKRCRIRYKNRKFNLMVL